MIQTPRLAIRTLRDTDWQVVYEYTANPVVMKYIPEYVFTICDAKKFVAEHDGGKQRNLLSY